MVHRGLPVSFSFFTLLERRRKSSGIFSRALPLQVSPSLPIFLFVFRSSLLSFPFQRRCSSILLEHHLPSSIASTFVLFFFRLLTTLIPSLSYLDRSRYSFPLLCSIFPSTQGKPRYTELLLDYQHTTIRLPSGTQRAEEEYQRGVRATHEGDPGRASSSRRSLDTDRRKSGTTDRISVEHLLFPPSASIVRRILLRADPRSSRRDSGVRELSPSTCLVANTWAREDPSCDPVGRYLSTDHPGGPLTRHDRPWDAGRNAPIKKTTRDDRRSLPGWCMARRRACRYVFV